jgi:hypothetical protein
MPGILFLRPAVPHNEAVQRYASVACKLTIMDMRLVENDMTCGIAAVA